MAVPKTETRRARARLVSISMFDDSAVLGLDPLLHGITLWVALIASADTEGRTEGSPVVLVNTILANIASRVSFEPEVVESLLSQMADSDLIKWYDVGSRKHVQLVNWKSHQRFTYPSSSDRPTPPITVIDHEKAERLKALQQRIATEIPSSVHNLHALAGRMWKLGFQHEEQIMEALKVVHSKGNSIKNPWAYIQSKGFINTSLARGVEEEARKLRAIETGARGGDIKSMAAIMRDMIAKTEGGS